MRAAGATITTEPFTFPGGRLDRALTVWVSGIVNVGEMKLTADRSESASFCRHVACALVKLAVSEATANSTPSVLTMGRSASDSPVVPPRHRSTAETVGAVGPREAP